MSERIPVVFLLDSLKRGGVQNSVLLQAAGLDKGKYDARAWALWGGGENWALAGDFEKRDVPVSPASVRTFHDTNGLLALAQRLRDEKIGLLVTCSYHPNVIGRMAARMAGTPAVVVWYHNTYLHRWSRNYVILERILRKGTGAFVCVSGAVRRVVEPLLGLSPEHIRILPCGLDLERFTQGAPRAETRARLGVPAEAPVVAAIVRLTKVKDVPVLLQAAALVRREIQDALFLIVGDGEERPALEAWVESNGLGSAIRFLGVRNDVPDILHAVDCAALSSLEEGLPIVMLEAFAARAPMVATPAGGIPEVLENERNGLLVPFRDPHAMARAIVRTLSNPEETRQRVEAAFTDVQEFGLERWIARTEEILDGAVASRRGEVERRHAGEDLPASWQMRVRLAALRVAFRVRKLLFWCANPPKSGTPY